MDGNIELAKNDERYDPYPTQMYIHHNQFENSHWFPTLKNDFGLLFLTKFPFNTPDIVWDGISPDRSKLGFCLAENGEITFADLDAANDFEALTTESKAFECEGSVIKPMFAL